MELDTKKRRQTDVCVGGRRQKWKQKNEGGSRHREVRGGWNLTKEETDKCGQKWKQSEKETGINGRKWIQVEKETDRIEWSLTGRVDRQRCTEVNADREGDRQN